MKKNASSKVSAPAKSGTPITVAPTPAAKPAKKVKVAAKPATKTATTNTIGRVEAATLVKNTNGKIFSATYIKKDGSERTLTGKLGVTKGVKGTGTSPDVSSIGMVRLYDMVGKGWKMLNLQTVSQVKTGGRTYRVR